MNAALADAWPTATAGPLLGWSVSLRARTLPRVTLRHLGAPLGTTAETMLAQLLSSVTRAPVEVVDVALPAVALGAPAGSENAWWGQALAILGEMAHVDSSIACVTRPTARTTRRPRASAMGATAPDIDGGLRAWGAAQAGRLVVTDGTAWTIRVAVGSCTPSSDSAALAASTVASKRPAPPTAAGGRPVERR